MIIGISGKIGSGKDEFVKTINELQNNKWQVAKFAEKLKQIVCLLTGCKREDLESEEFKDSYLPEEWNYIEDGVEKRMTYRLLLQKLGTEGMRDGVHKNIHINSLFANYSEEKNWCITDMRFVNEMAAVKKHKGFTVRIERLQTIDNWIQTMNLKIDFNKHLSLIKIVKNDFIDYIKDFEFEGKAEFMKKHNHLSETELDNHIFDAIIYNDGTLDNFKVKIKKLLHDLKIS